MAHPDFLSKAMATKAVKKEAAKKESVTWSIWVLTWWFLRFFWCLPWILAEMIQFDFRMFVVYMGGSTNNYLVVV